MESEVLLFEHKFSKFFKTINHHTILFVNARGLKLRHFNIFDLLSSFLAFFRLKLYNCAACAELPTVTSVVQHELILENRDIKMTYDTFRFHIHRARQPICTEYTCCTLVKLYPVVS